MLKLNVCFAWRAFSDFRFQRNTFERKTLVFQVIEFFVPLLCNYNKNITAQLDCLYAIEEHAASHENVASCLVKVRFSARKVCFECCHRYALRVCFYLLKKTLKLFYCVGICRSSLHG